MDYENILQQLEGTDIHKDVSRLCGNNAQSIESYIEKINELIKERTRAAEEYGRTMDRFIKELNRFIES